MHFWSFWAKYCHFLHILSNARPKNNVNKVPRWVFGYVGNKTFDFSSKKRILAGGCGARAVSRKTPIDFILSLRIGTLLRLLNLSGGQVLGDEGWTANSQVLVRSWLHGVGLPTRLQFLFVGLPTVQCSASYLPANCVNWSLLLKIVVYVHFYMVL